MGMVVKVCIWGGQNWLGFNINHVLCSKVYSSSFIFIFIDLLPYIQLQVHPKDVDTVTV